MPFGDPAGVPPLAVLRAALVLAGALEPDWRQPSELDVISLAREMLGAAAGELDWETGFLHHLSTSTTS